MFSRRTAISKLIESMKKLKEMGFAIAISHFGEDCSSLKYLKELPLTSIKLDGEELTELKDKIEAEREQSNYLKKFQSEYQEYEQLSKRHFFEKIFDRKLALKDIYDEASKRRI